MQEYRSWEDLLEPPEGEGALLPPPAASGGRELPPGVALPPEVQALLTEKEALEKHLKALTGQGEPDPEDARREQCFPVRAHTKESRIEERRIRRRDEHLTILRQRALARKILRERLESLRIEQRAAQERRLLAEQRRAATEAAAAAERERRLAEELRIRGHWVAQRYQALLERVQAVRGERHWQEEHSAQAQAQARRSLIERRQELARTLAAQTEQHEARKEAALHRLTDLRTQRSAQDEEARERSAYAQQQALKARAERSEQDEEARERSVHAQQRALEARAEQAAIYARLDRRIAGGESRD